MEKFRFFGVRLSEDEQKKLDDLARATRRSKSDIMRFALAQLRATGMADLELPEASGRRETEARPCS